MTFITENYDMWQNYQDDYVVASEGILHPSYGKQWLGESVKANRVCRYCKKGIPEVTFKSKSHAFPILLGNTTLIDNLECDACNKHFSEVLEDHFSKYINPQRTTGRIRGRTGIPSYRGKDGMQITVKDPKIIEVKVDHNDHDALFVPGPVGQKVMKLPMVRGPYVPAGVFKMFVKMALAIMHPNLQAQLDHLVGWILEKEHRPLFRSAPLYQWIVPGPLPPQLIRFRLYQAKAKSEDVVTFIFVLAVGNYQYQIPLPSKANAARPLSTMHTHPVLQLDEYLEQNEPPVLRQFDMAGCHTVRDESVDVYFAFNDADQPPLTTAPPDFSDENG